MDIEFNKPLDEWATFWLPADATHTATGSLIYTPRDGITVEAVGQIAPNIGFNDAGEGALHTIHGRLMSGTLFTLGNSFIKSRSVGAGGHGPVTLLSNRVLFGGHFSDCDTVEVTSCTFGLTSLESWLGQVLFHDEPQLDENEKLIGYDYRFRFPKTIEIPVTKQQMKVKIGWQFLGSRSVVESSMSMRAAAFIKLEFDKPVPLHVARDLAFSFQTFLSLLIGARVDLRWLEFTVAGDGQTAAPCRMLAAQLGESQATEVQGPLISYSAVKDIFSEMVTKWFARDEQAQMAAYLYFWSLLQESGPVEVRLLTAIQAIEAYYRSLPGGLYMEQEAFNRAYNKITAAIPPEISGEHRQSLTNRLRYGNEHSMRKRLRDLFSRLPGQLGIRIAAGNPKIFVDRVVDTRNYFTHRDEHAKPQSFGGVKAVHATERLKCLLAAVTLADLGVKGDVLESAINNNPDLNHWLSQTLPAPNENR
ncbi:MAG: HEPN domain-containing protein [Phycisphaerae bacterium]